MRFENSSRRLRLRPKRLGSRNSRHRHAFPGAKRPTANTENTDQSLRPYLAEIAPHEATSNNISCYREID